jgi:hypothetical protein
MRDTLGTVEMKTQCASECQMSTQDQASKIKTIERTCGYLLRRCKQHAVSEKSNQSPLTKDTPQAVCMFNESTCVSRHNSFARAGE